MKDIQNKINSFKEPAIALDDQYTIIKTNQAYAEKYHKTLTLGESKCYEISHNSSVPCHLNGEECPLKNCLSTSKAQSALHIHNDNKHLEYCEISLEPITSEGKSYFIEVLEQIKFATPSGKKGKLIGHSTKFQQLISVINKSAKTNINVLLHGETGTGKELVAGAIHQASKRKNKPFVIVECTGLNESLFESELFGHEKGAFTGAHNSKKGLVELANSGTLFLDEIADIPLNIQIKLLRLLETGRFRRVGGTKTLESDFRLICASHKDLNTLVENRIFREDLYYRIASFPIELPNLASRSSDIPLLAHFFLQSSEFNYKKFNSKCLLLLKKLPYKGNIRELKNVVERLAVLSDENVINETVLLSIYPSLAGNSSTQLVAESKVISPSVLTLKEAEYNYIQSVIAKYPSKPLSEIATLLGISVRTLYRKL